MRRDRRLLGLLAVGVLLLALPATALALRLRSQADASSSAPPSASSAGVSRIGTLFGAGSPDLHDCTASVIDSPHGDTLITAAHCVVGSGAGMTFAPDQDGASQPDGRWAITAVHVTRRWQSSQDPQEDVAFLTVAPQEIDGRSTEIQTVTGGYRLGPAGHAGERVQVTGYPEGSDDDAVTCSTRIYLTDGYPSFDCRGYADGTSGSPWVRQTSSGPEIVGVIGGLHQGGCEDDTSYSPIITSAVRDAYRLAGRLSDPDTAPNPGGNGC